MIDRLVIVFSLLQLQKYNAGISGNPQFNFIMQLHSRHAIWLVSWHIFMTGQMINGSNEKKVYIKYTM